MFRMLHAREAAEGLLLMVRQLLLLLVTLAGCASIPEYHAAAPSQRQGAVVRGHWSWATWRPFITIDKIEGLPRSRWDTATGPILVDPGARTLTVTGHKPGFLDPDDYLEGTVELKATLMAGQSYLVRFEIDEMLMTSGWRMRQLEKWQAKNARRMRRSLRSIRELS